MWARIENDEVMEVTDVDPEGRFHPSLVWLKCPADVQQGYVYDKGVFIPSQSEE